MRGPKGMRNEAFFQAGRKGPGASFSTLFRAARETGSLNLSSKRLQEIPPEVFCLDAHVEDGEKFWEVYPLTKVDLSHNDISHLNQEFSNLVELLSLKLRSNSVSTIPASIYSCQKLRHLDASSNNIRICESCRLNYLELQECLLQDNAIEEFPQFILCAKELRLLDLNNNRIRFIPDEICNLRKLTKLSLNGNGLEGLPDSFGESLISLVTLDLRKNKLSSLPSLGNMRSLQVLDVGENSLRILPSFGSESAISILHADCNLLRDLDVHSLASLAHSLCELHIHDNKISTLCPEVGLLNKLKVLDFTNNDIGDLPSSLGYIQALQRIALDGNPIRTIRRSLLSQSTVDLKTYLRTRGPPLAGQEDEGASGGSYAVAAVGQDGEQAVIDSHVVNRLRNIDGGTLDMSALELSELPAGWVSFVERSQSIDSMEVSVPVSTLNLSKNLFTRFPVDLIADSRLSVKALDMAGNRLGSGPAEGLGGEGSQYPLFSISVTSLDATKNGLSSQHAAALLSANRGHDGACSLSRLMLSHNTIVSLPSTSPGYRNLRELQLSFNKLRTLENIDFSAFLRLEILDVGNNKITSIGRMFVVRTLKTLLLENNELEHIPPELSLLKNIQSLTIHGNPQRTVRQGILQKGTDAILAALRSKLPMDFDRDAVVNPRLTEETVFREKAPSSQGMPSSGAVVAVQSRGGPNRLRNDIVPPETSHRPPAGQLEGSTSTKIDELQGRIASLETQMDGPVSEARKYALKKEVAKARANIMRLKRTAQSGP